MLGRGAQNRLARETVEDQFRARLYADTPLNNPLTRQVKRAMARRAAKAAKRKRKGKS